MAETDTKAGEGHNSRKALDFDGAAIIMKTKIATLNEKNAKGRGDLSAQWAKIEEMGLNKKASKHIQSMLNQSPESVSDYLRTFIGLLNPCGLGILRDMVDAAEDQNSISVPLINSPMINIDIDGEGSVATKAMRETAAADAAARSN